QANAQHSWGTAERDAADAGFLSLTRRAQRSRRLSRRARGIGTLASGRAEPEPVGPRGAWQRPTSAEAAARPPASRPIDRRGRVRPPAANGYGGATASS